LESLSKRGASVTVAGEERDLANNSALSEAMMRPPPP